MGGGVKDHSVNRQRYYDLFSRFYDWVIALHSKNAGADLRRFLVDRAGIGEGDRVLDICTGTGAVPLAAADMHGSAVMVTGLDFSRGMLKKACSKARSFSPRIYYAQADAGVMPFADCSFNAVTCSHAMYELQLRTRDRVLEEASRVLVPGGRFAMMEHCEPEKPFIRFLYRLRLSGLGQAAGLEFARDEVPFISAYFQHVGKELAPGGKSKVISGVKE